ncbi:MAG: ATP-binding protein [Burkholderiaceae bacterium]
MSIESRILLRATTARDAVLAHDVLARAAIESHACADLSEVVQELRHGAGGLMLAEEAFAGPGVETLMSALAAQPAWSDIPLLVLARPGANSRTIAEIGRRFGNVTLIEQPVRVAALVSVARSALRARERQYQMRTMLDGLAEGDRRKDEFLAMLAHELRNPLAPITTTLALLEAEAPGSSDVGRYHHLIRRQVEHMTRLVDDLLEVSRITRGKFELQVVPILLAEVIEDAIDISRPMLDARAHTLTVDAGAATWVEGDRIRLTQVFSNLLNNAAKYTPPGGRVAISVRREASDVVIEIADNGIGLAPQALEPIFQLFVQYNAGSRGTLSGLGIGLTLVRTLVERHGGSVRAQSAGPNQGSTFTVRLPLLKSWRPWVPAATGATPSASATDAAALGAEHALPSSADSVPPAATAGTAAAAPGTAAEDGAAGVAGVAGPGAPADAAMADLAGSRAPRRKVVMVVDDNRDAADSLAELLEIKGASVLCAYDAEQALDLARERRIDVAVLDIGLPGMDGCELARALRAGAGGSGLTLIALTGWGQEAERERIAAAGFNHHLVKPVETPKLLALLLAG